MAATLLLPLLPLAALAEASISEVPGSSHICCETKTVGLQSYSLLEQGATPSSCPSPCIYTSLLPLDNKKYCFAPGNLTSTCTSSSATYSTATRNAPSSATPSIIIEKFPTSSTVTTTSTPTTSTAAPATSSTNSSLHITISTIALNTSATITSLPTSRTASTTPTHSLPTSTSIITHTSSTFTITSATNTTTTAPGVYLYFERSYMYYKIKVGAGVTMEEGATASACRRYGWEAVCPGPSGCTYNDESMCMVAPLETDCTSMRGISKAICSGEQSPERCAELEGVFQYRMGHPNGDLGVIGGKWVSGKDHSSGEGGKTLWAYCVQPV